MYFIINSEYPSLLYSLKNTNSTRSYLSTVQLFDKSSIFADSSCACLLWILLLLLSINTNSTFRLKSSPAFKVCFLRAGWLRKAHALRARLFVRRGARLVHVPGGRGLWHKTQSDDNVDHATNNHLRLRPFPRLSGHARRFLWRPLQLSVCSCLNL